MLCLQSPSSLQPCSWTDSLPQLEYWAEWSMGGTCVKAKRVAHHVPWGPTGCGTAPLVHGAALLVVCVCKEMAPCGP